MVLILIEGAYSFRVDYEALEWFLGSAVHTVDWFVPDPETFRARVYSRTNTKATLLRLLQKDAIEQERLPGAILAGDRDDANVTIFQVH